VTEILQGLGIFGQRFYDFLAGRQAMISPTDTIET
jgi:hypothetical protein